MLEQIVNHKRRELEEVKARVSLEELLGQVGEDAPPSFSRAITGPDINIIAEIKYKSPSRGSFSCQLPPVELAKLYTESGAAALSVLTEKNYFAGDLKFLEDIHEKLPQTPLLRKDFILDRYQIAEARARGASAYLLIASCLSKRELTDLIRCGEDLDVEPLVEVHDPFELEKAVEGGGRIIGVNNRNLRTFEVDIEVSFDIAKRLEGEKDYVLVSESGIDEHAQILELREAGFSAFLIGSTLMDSPHPGRKLSELLGKE